MTIDLPKNLRLIKLPQKAEFILFLIKEELKNRKFTSNLEKAGFDVSSCYSGLGSLVLSSIGFEERPDELYSWYNGLLD